MPSKVKCGVNESDFMTLNDGKTVRQLREMYSEDYDIENGCPVNITKPSGEVVPANEDAVSVDGCVVEFVRGSGRKGFRIAH